MRSTITSPSLAKDKRKEDLTYRLLFHLFPFLLNLLEVKVISNYSLPKFVIFPVSFSDFSFLKICHIFLFLFHFFSRSFCSCRRCRRNIWGRWRESDNLLSFFFFFLIIIIYLFLLLSLVVTISLILDPAISISSTYRSRNT